MGVEPRRRFRFQIVVAARFVGIVTGGLRHGKNIKSGDSSIGA